MTMEESLGAALVRRRACAAPGGAKADAPPRSMSRGETIRAATMSDTLPAEMRFQERAWRAKGKVVDAVWVVNNERKLTPTEK